VALKRGRYGYNPVALLIVLIIIEFIVISYFYVQQSKINVLEAEKADYRKAEPANEGLVFVKKGYVSSNLELPQKFDSQGNLSVVIVAKGHPVELTPSYYNVTYFLLNSSISQILRDRRGAGETRLLIATVKNGNRTERFEKWAYRDALLILANVSQRRVPEIPAADKSNISKILALTDVSFTVERIKNNSAEAKWPLMSIYFGDKLFGQVRVGSQEFESYRVIVPAKELPADRFDLSVRFDNPYTNQFGEARSLYVDKILIAKVT